MSQTTNLFTIQVGSPGTYTNDGAIDMAPLINQEIKAAPENCQIDVIFNPGDYGTNSAILLPSNCSVIGNDATITALGDEQNGGLFANQDAYSLGPTWTITGADGTLTTLPDWSWNGTTGTSTEPSSQDAIIQKNISVQGMTFDELNGHIFGTWFINAINVDVQNNTYIGGADANAFVNVDDSVVSNNIAAGAAYDDWDGEQNVSIEDNASYTNGAYGALINSTPSDDPTSPGNSINDNITDNTFSTGEQNTVILNVNALLSYGYTFEKNITEQGNIFSLNNVPGNMAIYSADPMFQMIVQDNDVSGANDIGQTFSGSIYVVDSGANPTTSPTLEGNLIVGSSNSNGVASVVIMGSNLTALDNAVLGANSQSAATIGAYNVSVVGIVDGNVASGGTVTGSPVLPALSIEADPTIFMASGTSTFGLGLEIASTEDQESLSLTISSIFGTLSDSTYQNVLTSTVGGVDMIMFSGTADQIDQELGNVEYLSDQQGWNDSIEVQATSADGLTATRYIPVIINSDSIQTVSIETLASNVVSSNANLDYPGALTGGAIIASSGNSLIDMTGSISIVMLGTGDNTVVGGTQNGYISGGSGFGTLDLTGGGDITVAGGAGSLVVNALTGDDIIQPGAGGGSINLGIGSNSVYGGLGNFSITGGSGNIYLASLPENSGNFSAFLGTGDSQVFALSGDDSITTQYSTSNTINLGLGNSTVISNGNDEVYAGAGDTTINAAQGGNDTIMGSIGSLYFIGGSGDALIDSSGSTTVMAGAGNLNILPGQDLVVHLSYLSGSERTINFFGNNSQISLSGFGEDPITSQYLVNGILSIGLSDGSIITFPDSQAQLENSQNGVLTQGMSSIQNNQMVYNLDNILQTNPGGNNPGNAISSLIQSTPNGASVVFLSSGFQSNGVISF